MKIRVQHKDGRIETLTLRGQQSFLDGPKLNCMFNEYGREHFFTKDGYYDGWGQHVRGDMSMEAVAEKLETINLYRDFEPTHEDPSLM